MTAYNIVRFRVRAGCEQQFIDAHKRANPAFKGFSNALPSSPPACGATWKTLPGNSPDPPGGVPSYMGVLVSSSVANSGSAFSGNIIKIVVVLTQPGFGPSPGSPGIGTVVTTYCP